MKNLTLRQYILNFQLTSMKTFNSRCGDFYVYCLGYLVVTKCQSILEFMEESPGDFGGNGKDAR